MTTQQFEVSGGRIVFASDGSTGKLSWDLPGADSGARIFSWGFFGRLISNEILKKQAKFVESAETDWEAWKIIDDILMGGKLETLTLSGDSGEALFSVPADAGDLGVENFVEPGPPQ